MRLKRIHVGKYKNLIDFDCEFSESNIAAFIGNNGSGKSHILELITRAFSNAMNYYYDKTLPIIYIEDEPSVINCSIEYEVEGHIFQLLYNDNIIELMKEARANEQEHVCEYVKIMHEGKEISKSTYLDALPSNILLYYAGETKRQKGIAENTYDTMYDTKLKRAKSDRLPGLKYMDYYDISDLPLLLLSLAAYKGQLHEELMNTLSCKCITPKFSLILKRPGNASGDIETYWNSTGFVKYFLNTLRKYVSGTRDAGAKYFMFFDTAEFLRECSESEFELFSKLKALKNYGILEHIGIELEKNDGSKFTQMRLSEGEKQLGLIFLLTSFTAKSRCLYLFDEFDAYLHLNWQRSISKMLNSMDVEGHIIYTTHSPASISKMETCNVYKLENGKVLKPLSDTLNRALDEIMEEHLYVPMRPPEYTELVEEFRQAIIHNRKDIALAKLEQIKEFVGENDPFFITAGIALERME